jgi:hydrogenase assembly chaperone HypC/HupF
MCISCPQRVLAYEDGQALVEFQGREQRVRSPIPLVRGDYVLCHAGLVVKKIPEADAMDMLREWRGFNGF